jgi:hypothetical protein
MLAKSRARATCHAERAEKSQDQKTLHRKPPFGIEPGNIRLPFSLGTVDPSSVGHIALHESGGTRITKKRFPLSPEQVIDIREWPGKNADAVVTNENLKAWG